MFSKTLFGETQRNSHRDIDTVGKTQASTSTPAQNFSESRKSIFQTKKRKRAPIEILCPCANASSKQNFYCMRVGGYI
jgi:hypothetical protein